jgi:hypothetical protein
MAGMLKKHRAAIEQTESAAGNLAVGGTEMFGNETQLPIVMCPGCDQPAKATQRRPVGFSHGFVDVTYVCEACVIHTVRTIRPGDKALL